MKIYIYIYIYIYTGILKPPPDSTRDSSQRRPPADFRSPQALALGCDVHTHAHARNSWDSRCLRRGL